MDVQEGIQDIRTGKYEGKYKLILTVQNNNLLNSWNIDKQIIEVEIKYMT